MDKCPNLPFFRGTILGGFYMVLQRVSREIVPIVHSDNQLSNAPFIGFLFSLVSLSPLPHCLPGISSQTNYCHRSPCFTFVLGGTQTKSHYYHLTQIKQTKQTPPHPKPQLKQCQRNMIKMETRDVFCRKKISRMNRVKIIAKAKHAQTD